MQQLKQIQSIPLDRLVAHPANPNRMSKASFKKLVEHIKGSGNYEPVIVRAHPVRSGVFEIINGHHRVKALKELARESADCVVWQVGDAEAIVLLATLNRLSGRDDVHAKSELVKSLTGHFNIKELVAKLPDTKKTIERLKNLHAPAYEQGGGQKAFLNPVVFFLTGPQAQIVNSAIGAAICPEEVGTGAQKRAGAITKIMEMFLNSHNSHNQREPKL